MPVLSRRGPRRKRSVASNSSRSASTGSIESIASLRSSMQPLSTCTTSASLDLPVFHHAQRAGQRRAEAVVHVLHQALAFLRQHLPLFDLAQQFAIPAQLLFALGLLGDVDGRADQADDCPRIVMHLDLGDFQQMLLAVDEGQRLVRQVRRILRKALAIRAYAVGGGGRLHDFREMLRREKLGSPARLSRCRKSC